MLRDSNSANFMNQWLELRANTLSSKVILRLFGFLAPLLLLAPAGYADFLTKADQASFKRAFRDAGKSNWKQVDRRVQKVRKQLPKKALKWMRIIDPKGKANFREISAFIHANPQQARGGLLLLRRRLSHRVALDPHTRCTARRAVE